MRVVVHCPAGHKLSVPARHIGGSVRCPVCKQAVDVPAADPPPAGTSPDAGPPGAEAAPDLRYAADRPQRRRAHRLAGFIVALALAMLLPAAAHANLAHAPGWARLVVLVALLQLTYGAWLALAPDWSSLWVAMVVLAGVAALYATGLAVMITADPRKHIVLGVTALQLAHGLMPALWCGVVSLTTAALAYACGRSSYRWYKAVK